MQERKGSGLKRSQSRYNETPSNTGKRETMGNLILTHADNNGKNSLRFPSSIQKFNRERGLHPTQKPVALFEYLIKTYTNENDIVFDGFAGSFTTAIACLNTNRKYLCVELDKKYFEIGKKRIEEHNVNNRNIDNQKSIS
jgi:DNA modification methylase